MRKITKIDLFLVSLKSFFLQSVWNFKKMQNIGFAFCLKNILKKIYKDNENYKKALIRHLDFFNIHPYMSGIVLGIVIHLEEENNKNKIFDSSFITKIKNSMSGSLSAIGDSFIWGIWRPFAFLLVFFLWSIYNIFDQKLIFLLNYSRLFVIIFLFLYICIYNSLHFFLRFYCIYISNKMGLEIIQYIQKWKECNIEIKTKKIGCFLSILSLIIFFYNNKNYSFSDIITSLIILLIFFILKKFRRWKVINMILALFIIFFIIALL